MDNKMKVVYAVSVVAIFASSFLLSCGSNSTDSDSFCPVFTQEYELPQTQSADQLATFMETEHFEYDLDGWFFMGSLVDSERPEDTGVLAFSVQRVAMLGTVLGAQQVPVGVGFNSKSLNQWEFRGFYELDAAPLMTAEANPWRVKLLSPFPTEPTLVEMKSLSGRMGQVGTEYLLKADIPDTEGVRLKVEVRLRDRFGVINQGYGTAAFCVQNINSAQRDTIMGSYGGSVQDYLEGTGDSMPCQGDFYYQMPLLEVEEFSIMRGDTLLSKGTSGLIWADVISASYDQQALEVYKDLRSQFFAIQLPEEKAAIMVLQIDSANGSMLIATLYREDGDRTLNSARKPVYSWPIDGIKIEPDPDVTWTSPTTLKLYHMQYRIRLESADRQADLTITMAINNQEIVTPAETTYAGLGTVKGTLEGHPVTGQVFMEVTAGMKAD